MHNILEAYIESRCNKAVALVAPWSVGKEPVRARWVLGTGYCVAGRQAIHEQSSTRVVREILLLGTAGSPDVDVVVRMDFAVADFPANALEHWPDMCVEVPLIDPCERCKG
jgi:hypothetical protein